MGRTVQIAGKTIAEQQPAYIIAEMSGNHNQSFERSLEIIRAAKEAGADAIKIQTYTADTLTLQCDNEHFRIAGTVWDGRTLYDLYNEAYTPWDWQPKLQQAARDVGLHFFSTPFDDSAVTFLERLEVPAYKIASFEIVDLGLLARVARTGKPVIMSTGMATLSEVAEAVDTLRANGNTELVLLKCVSAYPAPAEDMNLRTIAHLSETFNVPSGLSDHSMGLAVPVAAVALGATVIEKHLCLSRSAGGPDSSFSLEPDEFRAMVDAVRTAERALGAPLYGPTPEERSSLVFRRSLFAVRDIRAGEELTAENIRSIRPAQGLHTRYLPMLLGRRAPYDIARGTPLSFDVLAGVSEGELSR